MLRPRSHLIYIRDGDVIGLECGLGSGTAVETLQVTLVCTQHEGHGLQAEKLLNCIRIPRRTWKHRLWDPSPRTAGAINGSEVGTENARFS